MKRIVLINDFIEHGAGTANILQPIFTAYGHRVSALLTAVMSHSFSYGEYAYRPQTAEMERVLDLWRRHGFAFDIAMTGFIDSIGDLRQFDLVRAWLTELRAAGTLIVADPVMGDGGALYPTLPPELVREMRSLVPLADILTPNVTEAALLLGRKWPGDPAETIGWAEELSELGPRLVYITDVRLPQSREGMIVCHERGQGTTTVPFRQEVADFGGSGDYFNGIALAQYFAGTPAPTALRVAAEWIENRLRDLPADWDMRQGLPWRVLPALPGEI